MNNIKIKVNGVAISLENSPVINDTSLEDMSVALSKESEDLTRQFKAIAFLSDVKTVESFGYRSTEGLVGSIKEKLVEWFKKLVTWLKRIRDWIKNHLFKKKVAAVKDPTAKQAATNLASDTEKLSAQAEAMSNKVVASIDGKEVEAEIIDQTKTEQKILHKVQSAVNIANAAMNEGMSTVLETEALEQSERERKERRERIKATLDEIAAIRADIAERHKRMREEIKNMQTEFAAAPKNNNQEAFARMDESLNRMDKDLEGLKADKESFKKFKVNTFEPKRFEVNRLEPTSYMKNKDGSQYKGNFNQFMNDKNSQLNFS